MRLALLIDDYMPDSTRVGAKMFHELACEFLRQGHDVVVITPGINQSKTLDKSLLDGVTVWKFNSRPIKDIGKIKRAINETMLSARAWRAIKSEVSPHYFDGIVYYSPTIFFSTLVNKLKKTCGCKSYLVLRDLFPQWAVDAGLMKEGSLIEKYFRYFERLNYDAADSIGLMSENNLTLFNDHFPTVTNTHILRNWANFSPVENLDAKLSYRKELSLENKIIYFYGGNIGHAQDMANLMRLAQKMQVCDDAHFLFVGQGDEVELIKGLVSEWELSNVTILPSIDQQSFKLLLSEVDVGLFSLAYNHTAHNFPGKLLGYMVESLPILGSVNPGNDLLDMIEVHGAGYAYINGEDDQLFKAAKALYDLPDIRLKCGKASVELLHAEFTVSAAAAIIIQEL